MALVGESNARHSRGDRLRRGLDLGGGWLSVYGGLGRIDVSEGDDLARAMHIGVTSMSPVFFQVRRGTRAVEPRS